MGCDAVCEQKHLEEMHVSFISFVMTALSSAWPCKEWRLVFPPEIIREQ